MEFLLIMNGIDWHRSALGMDQGSLIMGKEVKYIVKRWIFSSEPFHLVKKVMLYQPSDLWATIYIPYYFGQRLDLLILA